MVHIKTFFKGYWYADATRFIHNTIHEFQVWFGSFGLARTFTKSAGSFVYLLLGRRALELVVLGELLAIMMTNTWDVPIYGLLLGVWFDDLLKDNRLVDYIGLELFWSDGFGFFTLVGKFQYRHST